MKAAFIFVFASIFNSIQCYDSESFEYSGIEVSPLYETIIFSDIADIVNEFENKNLPFDKANNESESDEDVEDLLSEYHHYLEKAHKQRVNYLEKAQLKNKVPAIRHDKFSKLKIGSKHKEYHNKNGYFKPDYKLSQSLNNPLNMFMPFNSNKHLTTSEQTAHVSKEPGVFREIILNEENSAISPFSSIPFKPSCYCRDGRFPCKCGCKQCFVALDHVQRNMNPNTLAPLDEDKYMVSNPLSPELSDDTLNIRIKVDVQLPKAPEQFYNNQNRDKMIDYDTGISKEFLTGYKPPSPYLNFPIPMNLFGYKKMFNKHETSPLHKITIHKKKKSKVGNSSKKHRKKVITFHNIKIEPQLFQTHFGTFNISDNNKNENESNSTVILNLKSNVSPNLTTTNLIDVVNSTETQTEENIFLLVNISNHIENGTNENKTENSIETEYTNVIIKSTTDQTLHLLKKRDIASQNKPTTIVKKNLTIIKNLPHAKINSTVTKFDKEKSNNKKCDKNLPSDAELLYWPNNNSSKSKDISKNITTIILESENKKAKLNMSSETLRRNHTTALEKAIFGNVDWNDVDTVAPAFISFVGKYTEGILSFCSESVCHSMKCSKKTCLHRVCAPKNRYNNKGHCTGSNNTDSVASMESIMDLPSNIAFEIIDILQDRMIGKLFGKISLCINFKCITFAVSKKVFHKNKCTVKDLNPKGHCICSKEVKVA